ncbi:MAG: ribosome recycling factor [Candidatus Tectomicrobia bacterium]|uniref:Ribosome-recycling factor n=1 Tax=Tectimicrobiota bacterium TaxID=2528274 RepID=A0A932ZSP0_UNCTE|nr:ribosome recycling factor [Candidatus Tectomicrobia bacterium]
MSDLAADVKKRMTSTVESFKQELARVRTGRASTALISHIKVAYYGNPTPLNQLATLSAPEPQLLVVQPFDRSALGEIEKAIQKADLGLNPSNDGKVVRVPVPPLTEERRKEMVKLLKKMAEDNKIAVRNVRRDGNEGFKAREKSKEITEDQSRKGQTEVQKLTDQFISQIDSLLAAKEKEILEV